MNDDYRISVEEVNGELADDPEYLAWLDAIATDEAIERWQEDRAERAERDAAMGRV